MTKALTLPWQRERDDHQEARAATVTHFTGSLGPERERQLRAHLATCDSCRDHYDEVLAVSALDPRTPSPEDRLAQGLGFDRVKPRRWRWAAMPALAGLAAMGLWMLLATPPRGADEDAGFLARGLSPRATLPDLLTYSVEAGRRPRPVDDVIGAGDELAFAYRNPTAKQRLMVFAVDEHGHVYWYHPGWPDPATNPTAVPISTAPGLHELPAAVSQTYDGERLMLHALFTNRELTVRQVEEALEAKGDSAPTALLEPFRDGLHVTRRLRVRGAP